MPPSEVRRDPNLLDPHLVFPSQGEGCRVLKGTSGGTSPRGTSLRSPLDPT